MGSVTLYRGKRESYYIYRIDLPPDPLTGARKQLKVTKDRVTGARWSGVKACRAAMQAHEQELRSGVTLADTQPLAEYIAYWRREIAPSVKPNTLLGYGHAWQRAAPHLGATPLNRLSPVVIQRAIGMLNDRYAPESVRATYRVLSMALRRAVQWRLLPANPAVGIILPSPAPARIKRTWTVAQVQAFLAATGDDPDHALWQVLLDSGMRIGEALALTWRDLEIDGETPRVSIKRTLTRNAEGQVVIGTSAKTRRSQRSNRLTAETAAALRAHRLTQATRRASYGPHWAPGDLVFERGDGGLYTPDLARDRLQRACERAGLPVRSPHELRHTMITLAAEAGVPIKLLADRVGHSGTRLLEEVYAHATPAGDDLVSDALRRILHP